MEKRVSFSNRLNEKLAGTLHLPEGPLAAGVVIGHCFTCSRHTRILAAVGAALAKAGFAALRFDFSGNGQSEGDFAHTSYSKHIGEMQTAVDFLVQQGCGWIGLAGHSMGAAIAMLTAVKDRRVKAVCTLAGRYAKVDVSRLLDRLKQKELADTGRISFSSRGRELFLDRNFFNDAAGHDPGRAAAMATIPILAVHGGADDIIPVDEARRAETLNAEYVRTLIIESADHMFSLEPHRESIAGEVAGWFSTVRRSEE